MNRAINESSKDKADAARASIAEAILDSLKEVVFQTDAKGNWTFLTPAWEELTGFSVAASLGKNFLEFVHPEDRERNEVLFAPLVARQKEFCRHEIRYLRKGRGWRWVEVFARLSRDDNGVAIGTTGTLSDISERKAVEDQLRLAASVFGNAGEGIMVTSAKGEIVDVNTAFETITGYSRHEAIGKNPRFLRSGRQDKNFYDEMWRSLHAREYWQGEVWNRRKSGEVYVERLTITTIRGDDGKLSNYVGLFSDITNQKLQAQHLEHIAHYDPLTGLPNRRLLADRLQQSMARARRNDLSVAVVYIDLDGFKAVNDRHGHEYGDELLIAVAKKIQESVRDGDTACRLGGDEFVVVFDSIKCIEDCQPMILRLLDAVAQPIIVNNITLSVTGSMGISLSPQNEDIDADQLMRQADQAMYQAKMAGKNRFCVFDSLNYRSAIDRNEEIEALRRALANREFVLYYQPIVNLKSGELNSVEALIRWKHPARGILPPTAFLPLIEGHTLMLTLENWILEEALFQHERWLAAGMDIAISVNMSGIQLHQKDFVHRLRKLLDAHPLVQPRRLKLEVLETSALKDLDHVSKLIKECAEIGVSFSLDDFGTGYSTLRHLKQLPARRIKIDQGFVRDMLEDPDDLAILEGVIGMAAAFKREVIAEGVESVQHAEMLIQLGCILAQGYGIARPMPAEQVPDWSTQWRLPPVLANCATLERDDTLLLKALVENRACSKVLASQAGADDEIECIKTIAGLPMLDRWLSLCGAKYCRCPALVNEVIARSADLRTIMEEMGARHVAATVADAAIRQRFETINRAYVTALGALINA